MGGPADLARLVKGLDGKGDDAAFHCGDLCLGSDFHAYRGGGQMLQLQRDAHSGLAFGNSALQRLAGSAFHQRGHTGGGIYQQAAGADLSSGIGAFHLGDGRALHSNGDLHWYHILSEIIIAETPARCQ